MTNEQSPRGGWVLLLAGVVLVPLAGGCASGDAGPVGRKSSGEARAEGVGAELAANNAELELLYKADQADRTPGTAPKDWQEVARNDLARQARVKEMLESGGVKTGRDYYHAGMIFQHASGAEGVQLAHELAMIGASLGDRSCRWLAAASYDRMLMYLNRPQRFGTQYRTDSEGVTRLYEIGPGVTDSMRQALDTPTLQEAKDHEKEMQDMMEELRKSMKPASDQKGDTKPK